MGIEVNRSPRVAVIGYGRWGKNLVRNFSELAALEAVCDQSPQQRDACRAAYPDVRIVAEPTAVFEDARVTAVVIAAPAVAHADLARQALLADKDVFVEKPLALSVVDGQGIVDLAAARGRILMVGHLLQHHPAVRKLKSLVDAGALGRVDYVYSTRLNLGRVRSEESILWSFAPHDISVVLALLDETPSEVHAHAGSYLQNGVADVTVSLLSFPSGAKAHFFVSWLHPYKEQKLVVVGSKQMAVFDDQEATKKLQLYPHAVEWRGETPVLHKADAQTIEIDATEPLRAECQHFLDRVSNRGVPSTDGAEGLRVLEVLERCQRSLTGSALVASASAVSTNVTIHASAFIDADTSIGDGTTIWHVSHVMRGSSVGKNCRIGQNVVIGPRATVGDGCKIQNNVCVYEGVTLESDVFCGPSVVFTNVRNPRAEIPRMGELKPTLVRQGATLGANATIVCGTTIGRYAFVGAGAVVTRDVPDFGLCLGNPARPHGFVCRCTERLTFTNDIATCRECGLRYRSRQAVVVEEPAA